MCEKGRVLSVTVDTNDIVALLEVGRMFAAIADTRKYGAEGILTGRAVAGSVVDTLLRGEPIGPASLKEIVTGEKAVEEMNPLNTGAAADAFKTVEESASVDAGAAFAHAVPGGEADPLGAAGAGPAGPDVTLSGVVAAAHAAGATVSVGLSPGVETDKNGLPWDARINTSNKAKTQQGVWKRAPKLTDEFYSSVIAELKGAMNGAPGQAATPPAPPAPPNPDPIVPLAGAGTTAPLTPPAPPAPPAPATSDEPVPANFGDFLAAVSRRTTCNPPKLTKEEMDTCLQIVGATHGCALGSLANLNARPDLIPAVYAEFAKVWGPRG